MGFNTTAALAAADAYFKEGDARKEREYTQALRDADLSTLDDSTKARRTALQARTVQDQTTINTQPQREAEVKNQLDIATARSNGLKGRIPVENQTADINARIGLDSAKNTEANLPVTHDIGNTALKIQQMTGQAQYDMLPEKLKQAKIQGLIDEKGQSDVVLATMGDLLKGANKAGAIDFANKIAKTKGLLPGTDNQEVSDIQMVDKGQDPTAPDGGYRLVFKGGQAPAVIPVGAIRNAMDKMKTGEYQFIKGDDGSVFAGNKKTGHGNLVVQGDPRVLGAKHAQHTPAELQIWDRLKSTGVARNDAEAWQMVRSARQKTRQEFIFDFVTKNSGMGKAGKELADEAGSVFDHINKQLGGPYGPNQTMTPGLSNAGRTGSIDPTALSLIGAQ